jgi:hypothetical protein
MDQIIRQYLESFKVGAKQNHKNMTLFCLLACREADTDFLTLDDALDKQKLSITEVNKAGSVPELRVISKSSLMILMFDGEELVGAKQNRVPNVTVLLTPNSTTIIPVSCVEQGRWSYRGKGFRTESRAMKPSMKRKKTESVTVRLDMDDTFIADQGLVWSEIRSKHARMSKPESPTGAMSDLYDYHSDRINEYLISFQPVDKQIGMAIFIDGILSGIEILGRFDALRRSFRKLVVSHVMDALETDGTEVPTKTKPSKEATQRLLKSASNSSVQRRKSVALGEDMRLESEELVGAGLNTRGACFS